MQLRLGSWGKAASMMSESALLPFRLTEQELCQDSVIKFLRAIARPVPCTPPPPLTADEQRRGDAEREKQVWSDRLVSQEVEPPPTCTGRATPPPAPQPRGAATQREVDQASCGGRPWQLTRPTSRVAAPSRWLGAHLASSATPFPESAPPLIRNTSCLLSPGHGRSASPA